MYTYTAVLKQKKIKENIIVSRKENKKLNAGLRVNYYLILVYKFVTPLYYFLTNIILTFED